MVRSVLRRVRAKLVARLGIGLTEREEQTSAG
jgi:hypothetical protein